MYVATDSTAVQMRDELNHLKYVSNNPSIFLQRSVDDGTYITRYNLLTMWKGERGGGRGTFLGGG